MELRFKNLKLTSLTFPNRKLRNKSKKNWRNSGEQRMFLSKQSASIDGSDGDVTVTYSVPGYFKEMVCDNKVVIAGTFSPEEVDPELETLLDLSAQQKLKGKHLEDASLIELIKADLIDLKDLQKSSRLL